MIALDITGNTRTTTTNTFTVDVTPPESFLLTAPLHDSVMHTNRPEFTWEPTTDILSGLSKYMFFIDSQVAVDSIPVQQASVTLPDPFDNGTYTW